MRELGWWWLLADGERTSWWCALNSPDCEKEFEEKHASRLVGMCLAALRALGVAFTLAEGWDQQ